jgi:hypothetical protein
MKKLLLPYPRFLLFHMGYAILNDRELRRHVQVRHVPERTARLACGSVVRSGAFWRK